MWETLPFLSSDLWRAASACGWCGWVSLTGLNFKHLPLDIGEWGEYNSVMTINQSNGSLNLHKQKFYKALVNRASNKSQYNLAMMSS